MKNFIVLLLFLLIAIPSTSQNYKLFDEEKEWPNGNDWVIDSFKFDVNEDYSRDDNYLNNIYHFKEVLKKNKDLNVSIYVLMNSSYDTTSSNLARVTARNIISDLAYYNISPLRFQVKDSLVYEWDKIYDKDVAYRKILARRNESSSYQTILDSLVINYQKGKNELSRFIYNKANYISENTQFKIKSNELNNWNIPQLIESFHHQFFSHIKRSKFSLIPSNYSVQIGDPNISENAGYEEYNIPAWISFESSANTSFLCQYSIKEKDNKMIFLSKEIRRALEEFLGYNFSYKTDEITNIPSNITPVENTKRRLSALKGIINPKFEYVTLGACNAHTFWDFHWELKAPYTANQISINRNSNKAFIEYKDSRFKTFVAIFKMKGNLRWEYVKNIELTDYVIEDETPKKRWLSIFFALLVFGIFFPFLRNRFRNSNT